MRINYPGSPESVAGAPTLRLDQLEAIYRITHEITDRGKSKSVLVGAGMGSGKTVVSIEVILKTKPKRGLVVGVKNSYGQWAKTLEEQQDPSPLGIKRKLLRIDGSVPGRDNLAKLLDGDPGLFYIGLEMLRAQDWETVSETHKVYPEIKAFFGDQVGELTEPVKKAVHKSTYQHMKPLDLLISDESHKHSNQKSASIETIRSLPAVAKVALSGTFFGNKFENAWAVATWLWGKVVIGTKGAFEAEYCVKVPVMSKDGRRQLRSKRGFPLSKILGERNPGEFVKSLPCYVFIATPIGPVPAPEVLRIDLRHPEQIRQYGEMEFQSLTWIPSTKSAKRAPSEPIR